MNSIKTNLLVVGSGLAGTLFSLELAQKRPDLNILLVSKKGKQESSSYLAQGGIAAVLPDSEDSIEHHVQDTLTAGDHVNNTAVVSHFVSKSSEAILTLEKWGISFDSGPAGTKALALEGGHRLPRVLHHKDFTGKHIMQQLYTHLTSFSNIHLMEEAEVFHLIQTAPGEPVKGALIWDFKKQQTFSVEAGAVILSMGGVGSLFRYSTNPSTATGQGIALAEKAGAKVKDLIYIQFHPTALWQSSGVRLPLISEALRGAGAVLRNEAGHRFMAGQHPLQDLAPRDVVARAIIKELKKQVLPYVYLDATSLPESEWTSHFPDIYKTCIKAGVDPQKDQIPVVPAAHYSCGGVETDATGHTKVKHLLVLGELACTGLHGANRLASNSLLEATVMATDLASIISKEEVKSSPGDYTNQFSKLKSSKKSRKLAEIYLDQIRDIMQTYCSVVKTNSGLQNASAALTKVEEEANAGLSSHSFDLIRFELALTTAKNIVALSQTAKENKGVFYNQDLVGVYQ